MTPVDNTRKNIQNIMKPTRLNFCTVIRNSLHSAGYSSVKVLNVCNSALGEMELAKRGDDTTGNVSIKSKKDLAQVTVKPGSEQYKGKSNQALTFIAFNDLIAKTEKLYPSFESVTLPKSVTEWLDSLKDVKKEVAPANNP